MQEEQQGILWRIARLHPGWMALPVACVFILQAVAMHLGEAQGEGATLGASVSLVTSMLFGLLLVAYAFLVSATTSGRFHSRRPRSLRGPCIVMLAVLAGSGALAILGLVVGIPSSSQELGSVQVVVFDLLMVLFALAGCYLIIRASLDLVEAERGFGGGTGRKTGTVLLFVFWIVGVFFIQARLRRLVQAFAAGGGTPLPMERLELLELKPDKLGLVLTEAVDVDGFETYAKQLIQRLDGHVKKRRDLPRGPCWDIEIEGSNFRLVFDNGERRTMLEAYGDSELMLPKLQKWLAPAARS